MKIKIFLMSTIVFGFSVGTSVGQDTPSASEQRVPLTQAATALDAKGAPAIEATLRTTMLNGAVDAPVTNIRVVVKNVSSVYLNYASGLATFYDGSGVRCGEGFFKVDALAPNEAAETDAPGLRVTCPPATWRISANNLVPRLAEQTSLTTTTATNSAQTNFVISIDGEEHPLQLGKPIVLKLGDKQRTIIVRHVP